MKVVHEWQTYTLAEVAKKTGKTESDLLRLAAQGDLPLYMWSGDTCPGIPRNCQEKLYSLADHGPLEWVRVPEETIGSLMFSDGCACQRVYSVPDEEVIRPAIKAYSPEEIRREKNLWPDNSIIPPYIDIDELQPQAIWIKKKQLRIFPVDLNKLLLCDKNMPTSATEDLGEKIRKWKNIADYMDCSISTAKTRLKGRRFKNSLVKKGGNKQGGVWAWSKALDYIKENPAKK